MKKARKKGFFKFLEVEKHRKWDFLSVWRQRKIFLEAEKLEKCLTNALKKGFSKFLEVEKVFFGEAEA